MQGVHRSFPGVSSPDCLEAHDRFTVKLVSVPHVQQHLAYLCFKRSFAQAVNDVSPYLCAATILQ